MCLPDLRDLHTHIHIHSHVHIYTQTYAHTNTPCSLLGSNLQFQQGYTLLGPKSEPGAPYRGGGVCSQPTHHTVLLPSLHILACLATHQRGSLLAVRVPMPFAPQVLMHVLMLLGSSEHLQSRCAWFVGACLHQISVWPHMILSCNCHFHICRTLMTCGHYCMHSFSAFFASAELLLRRHPLLTSLQNIGI